ncbi:angiopoietin-related protein 7-like [Cydia fagiglandana]|uniref:angiopoietin-related protein 7-like n=1 Tax=Cydia fagiglandana TaxID=1458189 RepID=UPI002FEE2D29
MTSHQIIMTSAILYFTCIFIPLVDSSGKESEVKPLRDSSNDAIWKEYEHELNDAMMFSKRRDNVTRQADTEAVIEKIMDTITSSEKYLKKVDSIDYKLNRLDIEVHDKTNDILKYLGEIMKSIRGQGSVFKAGSMIDHLSAEVGAVKKMLMVQGAPRSGGPSGSLLLHVGRPDARLEERLSQLESSLRSAAAGIDTIMATIAEVKNRPSSKEHKSDLMDASGLISEFRRTLQDQKSKKCDCKSFRADRSERYPLDCFEIQMQGFNVSGIFKIHPDGMEPFYVLCDLTTAGGGWTVFQNRFDGSQDFYKSWSDYKHGFGNLAGEFWLGLEKLHYLTNQKLYELRVELETQNGHEAYAAYSVLTIGPEYEGYRISTLGTYYGTAGDSLSYHAGQKFSAMDMDHDEWKDGSCAVEHGGAWWYKECDKSNLNGLYVNTEERRAHTIYWISFKGPSLPITRTKMMIRPLPARRPVEYPDQPRHLPEMRGEVQGGIAKPPHSKAAKSKPRRPDYRLGQPAVSESFYPGYA